MADRYVIFNVAGWRWRSETYATEADARHELKNFWRGTSGVDLNKFYVEAFPAHEATTIDRLPYLHGSAR